MVPEGEQTSEISVYHYPKTVEDNQDMFPTIACIPDVMLRKVDQTNPIFVAYLKTINPSIETKVLLQKYNEGPSKKRRGSKKDDQASP